MASTGAKPNARGTENPSPTTEGPPEVMQQGHFFSKKTFHKPTYCHHCTDMLWGLIGQGLICEVCNFVVHERCLKTVVSPCSTITPSIIKNPVPHCWGEPGHLKRRFCNVCRKRIEDSCAVRCEVCDYSVHVECQDFGVADCKECATYVPSRDVSTLTQHHHWREGNLPANSKCQLCKKTCWSAECLAGMRCEWCNITAHPSCYKSLPVECTFGCLESIMLPPACVSIPRTDVPLETIIGGQMKRRDTLSPRSISEEFSSSSDLKSKDYDESSQKDKDEETIKVFDGNGSMKSRMFRTITVSRNATKEQII
ncbi:diacylglycerol kinase theta-like, partial [Stegodyphus dumicola]|uniref:diacylglycerol kinase theta-like n=1 Tax=Stegodyphus dumicola TaxID=202533 RepID=UPI0015B2692C